MKLPSMASGWVVAPPMGECWSLVVMRVTSCMVTGPYGVKKRVDGLAEHPLVKVRRHF